MENFFKKLKYYLFGLRRLSFAVLLLTVTTPLLVAGFLASSDFGVIWAAVGASFMGASLLEDVLIKKEQDKNGNN